jgi:hypothetical protein
MGIGKWLKRGKSDQDDEVVGEYTLVMMKPGFLVDFDLKTWQVTATKEYDYEGDQAVEWELHAEGEVRFLERSEDDGRVELTFTRSVSIRDFDEDVMGTILDQDDPPEVVHLSGREYTAIESATGTQREADKEETEDEDTDTDNGRDFVSWTYESEDGHVVFALRWGDRDFSAYEGVYVEEYQFTDILPATLS